MNNNTTSTTYNSLSNIPVITFAELLRPLSNNLNNNNNNLNNGYYTYDIYDNNINNENLIINNNNILNNTTDKENDVMIYNISDKILNNINQDSDFSNIKQLLENKLFENISDKINIVIKKLFDMKDIDFITSLDIKKDDNNIKKDDTNIKKFINTLDLYNKIKEINNEYNLIDDNENNKFKIKDFILKILNNNTYNENFNNLNNILDNYYNFISSNNIFNFDIKEYLKNQEYIIDITNKKIDEYNDLQLLLDKKINLYYKIHVETKNYISILNNNYINNNILSSSFILKNYIQEINNKIINDNEIYDIIKKIINLKLELDFFYILFCKNGIRNDDINSCSICKTKKISCCAIPCGHTYCISCIKTSKKCSYCKQNINNIQKIYIL